MLRNWFSEHDLEYVIYGSFNNPKKVRPWLSDIDFFIYKDDSRMLFPIEITEAFWGVRSKIEELGIPLQPNWITSAQFLNPVFWVDVPYLEEVRRWLSSAYKSDHIEAILNQDFSIDPFDDQHMMRYFQRKIKDIWGHFYKAETIFHKNPEDIDENDQKILWILWDEFKKMISLIAISLRIKTRKSLFSLPDRELIQEFQKVFPHEVDYSEYISTLESTRSLTEWYSFLSERTNRVLLRKLYNDVFNASVEAIWQGGLLRNS